MTETTSFIQNGLAVLIPTFNEAEGIGPTLEEIREVLGDTLCLVVDRSMDETPQIAERLGAKVVRQNNRGKGNAVNQGLGRLNGSARYIAMIDGDYTYPAEAITKSVSVLERDPTVGMVNGNRFSEAVSAETQPLVFNIGNRIIIAVSNLLSRQNLADPLTGLRVFRAELFKDWKPSSQGFDIEVEMNHYVRSMGYKIQEIPIRYRARLGEKKLGMLSALPILFRIVRMRLRGDLRRRSSH